MYKVGICGYLAEGVNDHGGQPVKTRAITAELINVLGKENVRAVDTYNWRKRPLSLLIQCINLEIKCENIIILPASHGIRAFVPLFIFLNKMFHRKLHYIVIGGWLPELLEKNNKLKFKVCKFDEIYVETHSMVEALKKLGLQNVKYLPNFKRLDILEENKLVYQTEEPYKLCTFSRVTKEKGIEDAIDAVMDINNELGKQIYTLDIYGQVEGKYKERFEKLKKDFPEYITYRGAVNYDDSVKVLKNYFALLFPTYYMGEGFPGTILDAFAAGVPIIATNWRYNAEIIQDKFDGLIYDYQKPELLKGLLLEIYNNPAIIINMKRNCLKRAKGYMPEAVIKSLIKYL